MKRDFPAKPDSDTLPDRAMRKARSQRLIPQPSPEFKGEETPRSRRAQRARPTPPERPSAAVRATSLKEPSAEAERSSSISAALLKGAAMVPDSSVSGTLRGLLGGASVGMDIDTALTSYRDRKRSETAQTAVQREETPSTPPPTPLNVPPDVVGRALGGNTIRKMGQRMTRLGRTLKPKPHGQKKAKANRGMEQWGGMPVLD